MVGLPKKKDNNILQQWYDLFKSCGNINSARANFHWKKVINSGLPNCTHENWKYTPLDDLLSKSFVLPSCTNTFSEIDISKYALPIDAIRLVFVDGKFNLKLSTCNTKPFIIHYKFATEEDSLPIPINSEIFLHLTESLAEEVTFIYLPKNKSAMCPLYLLHITSGRVNALNTVNYRHHLEMDENSEAEIIEHYVTLNSTSHFTGSRFTFNVGNSSRLNHIKLAFEETNSYHLSHNDIMLGSDINVTSTSFLFGNRLLRQNLSVQLNGENTQLSLNSLVFTINSTTADIRSYVEHKKEYCISRQLHKTISRDNSLAIFDGHIKVSQFARKTNSKMINNNLLLGNLVKVNTKPQLEIYTDDIKCGHAATVGYIDDEQIFYLCSRGIDKNRAQQMLIFAFATEITEKLKNNVLRNFLIQDIISPFFGANL